MKKFWKYFLITILLLIALALVGVLYLFFVPGASLFGIRYISLDEKHSSKVFETGLNFSTISVTSQAYNVEIVPLEDAEDVSVSVYANSLGFVLNKHSTVNISGQIKNSVLYFNIEEPSGWATKNRSLISVYVPAKYSYNYILNNQKAQVNVKTEKETPLKINNLNYTTQSGDFALTNSVLDGKLNLDLNRATFTISDSVELKTDGLNALVDVDLKFSSGKFDAPKSELHDITILQSNSGIVNIKSCRNLTFNAKEAGGRIVADKIENLDVSSTDTNVTVKELDHGTVRLDKSGSVNIEHVISDFVAKLNRGSISINKADSTLNLKTEDGNISVEKATFTVTAETSYGNINVTFDSEAGDYNTQSTSRQYRQLVATTKDGKITAKDVQNIKLTVKDNGDGRADIYMNNVFGENYIHGNNGEVYVKVKEKNKTQTSTGHAHYKLTTSTSGGNVSVNLNQFTDAGGYSDKSEKTTYVNSVKEDYEGTSPRYSNSFEIRTNKGDLIVRDDMPEIES